MKFLDKISERLHNRKGSSSGKTHGPPSITSASTSQANSDPLNTATTSAPAVSLTSNSTTSQAAPAATISVSTAQSNSALVAPVATQPGIVTPGSNLHAVKPQATPAVSQPTVSKPGPDSKLAAWAGLRTLASVVQGSAEVFGPLKSAVDAISGCVEIYENAGKSREDYKTLRVNLESQFEDLAEYLRTPVPAAMTLSIENLANGITREMDMLRQKEERKGGLGLYANALEDQDEILESYRRIQMLLGRMMQNANLSIWKIVDEQATKTRIKDLSPSLAARFSSAESSKVHRGGCTPHTRTTVLTGLNNWTINPQGEKIYWLNAMAGTGKTTIAYTFCEGLQKDRRLAASFFCSRQLSSCRDINLVLPTISYQLAQFSRPFRSALSRVLEEQPDLHTQQLSEQFEGLVHGPLLEIKDTVPIDLVVVIDALDECDDDDGVDRMLKLLLSHVSSLPVKFFLTSRPEPKILDRMRSPEDGNIPLELRLHELETAIVHHDIRTYLQHELAYMTLSEENLQKLVEQSGVLFIYAATVVRYVKADSRARSAQRLKQVLDTATASTSKKDKSIDELYDAILTSAFDNDILEEEDTEQMKFVLDTVVCAQEPLTTAAISGLLKIDDEDLVHAALQPLYSVLYISEAGGPVMTLHASFPDYLFQERRSKRFYCDTKQHNARLAQSCFDLICAVNPPFNICKLDSSYVFDKDVSDIEKRVDDAITQELLYACRFWGFHLQGAEKPENLFKALHEFLLVRLLLWMEILNLRRYMIDGAKRLARFQSWYQNHGSSDEIREFVQDASRFVAWFSSNAISQSTPHIYVSGLLFWPKDSPVSRNYSPKAEALTKKTGSGASGRESGSLAVHTVNSGICCVAHSPSASDSHIAAGTYDGDVLVLDAHDGHMIFQPLKCHNSTVSSLAYSPDGARIASGSGNATIRIWDAHTGQMIGEPLEGHTDCVYSISFSPDGTRIASGSFDGTIRIWDASTGKSLGEPIQGDPSGIFSVKYSPDGARIVSGSYEGSVRVWDVVTGQMVGEPLMGHTHPIYSVAYSPDGTRIVSGSWDQTIRIWDTSSGLPIGEPFRGHNAGICSVAYSPDGAWIVSGSLDNTVRIWDAQTGQMFGEPLQGHHNCVYSVTYSPDGTRIVSGSLDKTIRIWDAQAVRSAGESLQAHSGAVTLIKYSPDGAYFASCSADKTIIIWDAYTNRMVGQPLKGHTDGIYSIDYSPDGTRLVSCSIDKTLCLWDVQNGQMIGKPFQGHTRVVCSVSYSSDGIHVASCSYDSTVRIWDARSGQMVGEPLQGHKAVVYSVAYAPNGTRLASGSWDHTLRIWDAYSGQMVGEPLVGHDHWVYSVAYSSDGTRIVSGSSDNTVRIWDAETGQTVGKVLEGHTDCVYSVGFSPDGTRIVSGSQDNTIRIWDACDYKMVGKPLQGHTIWVYTVTFSPDGSRIASGSSDKAIRIWDAHALLADTGKNTDSTNDDLVLWSLNQDGWAIDSQSRLLTWVPFDLRVTLIHPHNTALLFQGGSFTLYFNNASMGESWRQCYRLV